MLVLTVLKIYNYGGWIEVGGHFLIISVSMYPFWLGEVLSPLNLRNPFQTISMTFLGCPDIFPRFVTKFLKVLGDGWAQIQPWNREGI